MKTEINEDNFKKNLIHFYRAIRDKLSKYGLGNFYVIKKINNSFLRYAIPKFVIISGHKIYLDPVDSLKLSVYDSHEEPEIEIAKTHIKKGGVVLDIGANIGYNALIFAKLVGENGKVFAFEPDPSNFKLLEKNIKVNNYKNVVLINKAVSGKNEKINLYLSENRGTGHKIYNKDNLGNNLNRDFIEIESMKLDDYFKNKEKVDFVKIDVEGAESEVIKGMKNLLKKNKKINMILEITPGGLRNFGVNPKAYLKEFLSGGFKIYEVPIEGSFEKGKVEINQESIDDFLKKWDKTGINIFCTRS